MERSLRRKAGFSLIELMISAAIVIVVVAAVMQGFVVQNRAYTVTDQVVEAQQNLRAVAWLLERDARMTGFLVPEAAALCAIDQSNGPDTVWFTDSDALDPEDQSRPALGAELQSAYASSTTIQNLTVDDTVLDDSGAANDAFYDNDGDGVADADFLEGGGAILVNLDDPAQGTACGLVLDVGPTNVRVDFLTRIAAPTPGDRLILVPAHVYQVQPAAAGGGEPQLVRNGRAIATGVEDLQVAFFFDRDRDGRVDDEGQPNSERAGEPGANLYASDLHDNRDLREIRINLVTRTRREDVEIATGQFQARENRVAPAGNDGFRRRVHTSTVKLRNVGYRGTAT
jgi:type II secretory pathway pseudopilin PulG